MDTNIHIKVHTFIQLSFPFCRFIDVGGPPQADLNQPWRVAILDELRSRIPPASVGDFENYENAVETSSWIRTGEARCLLPADGNTVNTMYEDCVLQLEWIGNSGTFTMLHPDGATTKVKQKKNK